MNKTQREIASNLADILRAKKDTRRGTLEARKSASKRYHELVADRRKLLLEAPPDELFDQWG